MGAGLSTWQASLAQWQSNGFVNRRSSVRPRQLAPSFNRLSRNGNHCNEPLSGTWARGSAAPSCVPPTMQAFVGNEFEALVAK